MNENTTTPTNATATPAVKPTTSVAPIKPNPPVTSTVKPITQSVKSVTTTQPIAKPVTTTSNTVIQSNININFKPKNNNDRSDRRPQQNRRPIRDNITSEAFLRHRDTPKTAQIKDPTKLIKKDEIPLRIIPL